GGRGPGRQAEVQDPGDQGGLTCSSGWWTWPAASRSTTTIRSETFLCYHAVSPTWDHRLSLTPELFRRQLRAMRLLGPVHVTFDDAYRNIESTVNDLVKQGIPVTIFVCTGYADRG